MKFGTIVFLLSVFVLTQSVVGHRATSRCHRNNMILKRRVASLFHRNKELMCMVENAKPKECSPSCGELEVCTTGGTCECGDTTVRDGKRTCVPATPIECTPACGELEVCTTGGTCECDSSSIRDTNGSCVPAVPIECTPACGEGEVCTTEGKCECGSSLARDSSGNCVPATTGYCGPTYLTSTCTNCDSDTGEITLNLTTGESLGNLIGATVESMAVTTDPGGAGADCNYKSRVKVTFEPEKATACRNLLRIQMTFGQDRSTTDGNRPLFHFGDSITNTVEGSGDDPDTQSHDASILGWSNGGVYLVESTHGGSCDGDTSILETVVLGPNTTHATVLLAHRYSRVQINGGEFDKEVGDKCSFELNDADDHVAPDSNRDLYIAFNRAVNSEEQSHDVFGVCSVKLSWVCNVANP